MKLSIGHGSKQQGAVALSKNDYNYSEYSEPKTIATLYDVCGVYQGRRHDENKLLQ